MHNKILQADLLLFLAALIWGVTFIVQKGVVNQIDAFSFTGVRFILGGLMLLPIAFYVSPFKANFKDLSKSQLIQLLLLGPFLLGGSALQQLGLELTSEANSGFITTLYVVLTPLFSYFLGQKFGFHIWIAIATMLTGLYFLSITDSLTKMNYGDFLTLICAVFWTFHILILSFITKKVHPLWIAVIQNLVCGLISLIISFCSGNLNLHSISITLPELIWSGCVSVSIAYTLQIYGQRTAPTTHVVIILSLEAVIAAIAAMIYHNQLMTTRAIFGASLMFIAVLIAELWPSSGKNKLNPEC